MNLLTKCPICNEKFEPVQKTRDIRICGDNSLYEQNNSVNQLHMIQHFRDELCSHIGSDANQESFSCLLVGIQLKMQQIETVMVLVTQLSLQPIKSTYLFDSAIDFKAIAKWRL